MNFAHPSKTTVTRALLRQRYRLLKAGNVDIPQPPPDVVPMPGPPGRPDQPVNPPSPPEIDPPPPPEIKEPPWPAGRPTPVREPLLPGRIDPGR